MRPGRGVRTQHHDGEHSKKLREAVLWALTTRGEGGPFIDLSPEAEFYLDAFWELSTDRRIEVVVGLKGPITVRGPIPFSAISSFARCYGIEDVDEFEMLRRMVRAADDTFIEFYRLNPSGAPAVSQEPLSSAMFRAAFTGSR